MNCQSRAVRRRRPSDHEAQLIQMDTFFPKIMEADDGREENLKETVRELQASFFPISPRCVTGSFLANFLLKSPLVVEEDDSRLPKIKETLSKDFFSVNRDQGFIFQLPRWPTECQVLEGRISHISYVPPSPESYYVPTGNEAQPKPIGEECGIIVYQYYPISAVNYFSRSSVGGSKYLLPTCPAPEENSLRFESRFESGNLAKAIRITPNYYELYLRTDLYTNKHMQWFYFKITNMRKNFLYRFSIVNLSKDDSLYNEGMKPLMYSKKDSLLHTIGWRHCGDNITYFCNDNVSSEDPDQQMSYTLTFTLEFPHDDDEVYLAHSYPYTYSDLQDYLMELSEHPIKSSFSTLRLLCKTLAGNNVYYVTVTSPTSASENKKKRAIVISARVHPGETPASWMMKGVLDFLTSDSTAAKELREKFIFKIVPMLNPDGVIVGNNRCSLTGRDLNRQYRTVIRETYPSIWYTKLMICRLLEECGVAMYCDLHAHSRKHNVFIYGCENRRKQDRQLFEQVFPLMLHKNAADKFSFENCHFRIQRTKEGTGRVVMWMMGIANSYTMEASFGGSTMGSRADTHFCPQDYEQMGRSFCQTLLDFYDEDPRKEKLRIKIITRLLKEGSSADEPTNIKLSDYSSDEGDSSTSSSTEYREDFGSITLVVPPPSPIHFKKAKPKLKKKNPRNRSPNVSRKPLPMCKATLELSVTRRLNAADRVSETSDDSDSESDVVDKEKSKPARRRKKKKKVKKKQKEITPFEAEYATKSSPPNSLSVLELTPLGKLRAHSWHRSIVAPPHKILTDTSKRITTQQLIEVQAKLNSLRNRLWLGVGGGEPNVPLSWGTGNFSVPPSAAPVATLRPAKTKKKSTKNEKSDKKTNKKSKHIDEKTAKKPQTGLKRQPALEWAPQATSLKIRKAKSLPDSMLMRRTSTTKTGAVSCDEGEKIKTKKHKKRKTKSKKAAK